MDNNFFECSFEKHLCLAINENIDEQTIKTKLNKYDICIVFYKTSQYWLVKLFSEKTDVGEIVKKYGGSGDSTSAFFYCIRCPEFISEQKLVDQRIGEAICCIDVLSSMTNYRFDEDPDPYKIMEMLWRVNDILNGKSTYDIFIKEFKEKFNV